MSIGLQETPTTRRHGSTTRSGGKPPQPFGPLGSSTSLGGQTISSSHGIVAHSDGLGSSSQAIMREVGRMDRTIRPTRLGLIRRPRRVPWTQGMMHCRLHLMWLFLHHRCLPAPPMGERLRGAQKSVDASSNKFWVLVKTDCMSEGGLNSVSTG